MKNRFESWLQKQRYRKVQPYLKGKILDFGCGDMTKLKLHKITGEWYDYTGVDKGDMIPDGKSYDTIVMCAVMEHLTYPDVVLKILFNYLNPGGRIIITVPSPSSKSIIGLFSHTGVFSKEGVKSVNEHKKYFSKQDLSKLGNMVHYETFQFGLNQLAVYPKSQKKEAK